MPSAGVYKKEIDLSLYVEISSNLSIGVVHTFAKGPINERVLIPNLSTLESTFGRPINDDQDCQGFFAVREYLGAGNQAWVVRAESSANPAEYAKAGLRGATDKSLTTNTDGTTSSAATRTLTSSASSFITAGTLAGDVLEVQGGSDAGFYLITNVAATVLTIDRDWPTGAQSGQTFVVWSCKHEEGSNGATSAPSARTFTSSGSTFLTNGVKAGDVLSIQDTGSDGDNGYYVVLSVTSETTLVVNRDWVEGSNTGLTFTVYGDMHPSGSNGSTATAGEFSSSGAKFQLHDVKAGDLLIIEDTSTDGNNGTYLITGVKGGSEQTTVTVANDTWPAGSLSSLTYRIVPGCVYLQGESKGTWANDFNVKASVSSIDGQKFNLNFFDKKGFLVETIPSMTLATVEADMLENSADFPTATVMTSRLGPALEYTATFEGGEDGASGIVDADLIGTGSDGLQQFRNKEDVQIDLLMIPGYTSQNIGDSLINMAEFRGDCIAIVDPPDSPTVSTAQEVFDWHNGDGGFGREAAFNSSFGATYWPWVKLSDNYNDEDRWCAPSVHLGRVMAFSENASQPWFAPAGTNRGLVKGSGADVRKSPEQGERDLLQVQGNVNPIVKFKKEGITVFGQKSLLRANSALNRINTRRMLIYCERNILDAARSLSFEPNDSTTDREFVQLVTPLLEFVRDNRGLREFMVLADNTTSPDSVRALNKMIAKIYLKPTTTAEVIEVQFVLTSQTANFQEFIAG